jgi:hypothetical protein
LPFEHAEAEYDAFIQLNAQLTAAQMSLVLGIGAVRAERWSADALDNLMRDVRDLRAATEALCSHTGRNVARWRRQRAEWEQSPAAAPLQAVEEARSFLLAVWAGGAVDTPGYQQRARDLAGGLDRFFDVGDADA